MKKNDIHKIKKKHSIGLGYKFLQYSFKYPVLYGLILKRNYKSVSNLGMGGRVKQLHQRKLLVNLVSLPNSNMSQSIQKHVKKIYKI